MKLPQGLALLAGLAAGLAALAGCSAPSPAAASPSDHPWTPQASAPSSSGTSSQAGTPNAAASSPAATTDPPETKYGRAPLDAFLRSQADSDADAAATNLLVTDCMKTKGFSYQPTDSGVPGQAPASAQWSDYLGITDMQRAKTYGYQTADMNSVQAKVAQVSAAPTATADPSAQAYAKALYGSTDLSASDQGCYGEADAQLRVPADGVDVSIQGELALQASQQAQANSSVLAAQSAWSQCMAAKGYTFATPMDALSAGNPVGDVTQAGIDQAVTDVTCKQSTGLSDTYITTLYQAQKDLISSHRAQLDAYSAWLKAGADKARTVLGK